jgi:hypothetical protein
MVVLGDESKGGPTLRHVSRVAYVKEKLAKGFEVVEFIERGSDKILSVEANRRCT